MGIPFRTPPPPHSHTPHRSPQTTNMSFTMQSVSFKSNVAQKLAVESKKPVVAVNKTVTASGRREALGAFFAGVSMTALQAQAIEVIDFRNDAKMKGFQEIYEARELTLPTYRTSDDKARFALKRLSVDDTKERLTVALDRMTGLKPFIETEYYLAGCSELRTEVGYLRFDLKTLADTKTGADKKEAITVGKKIFEDGFRAQSWETY